ncbi:urease accessory protein UreE [Segetibacter aerophilus]|uniref:Urease accessory protein UreE n=1 Tax=Segetibacter aerophilus TaxID=670293 RepID=A0A512BE20_9BACT|nr:urease accessory protein UreE [Segetibacter aerophilus]GEO10209.1 urease accessory protein UreE [Segetibacter aerophilus]
MVIKQKIGNLTSFELSGRTIDLVPIEWFEANKRIFHKRAKSGTEVIMKFMNEAQFLTEGDVLWEDENSVIAVEIQPCEAIIITPASMYQMASVCYEIGNKHLPLFFQNEEILIPFEPPIFKLLSAAGFEPKREMRKLVNPLKTTVSPHGNEGGKQSLFSKILQLTTSASDV